jgi:hypothetical protein
MGFESSLSPKEAMIVCINPTFKCISDYSYNCKSYFLSIAVAH